MDNLRERVENALRFAPERMEKVILNAHFQPYFVKYGAFAFLKTAARKRPLCSSTLPAASSGSFLTADICAPF